MMEDAQVDVLLSQEHLAGGLSGQRAEVISLDSQWESIERERADNPVNLTLPANAAYVIYTSGSTGVPKAAVNTHEAICNRLLWMQDAYGLSADDRVLQKTPFSFDVSVWEFFWPLMTGARLVVARPEGHRDSDYLSALIARQQITTLHFVPSMLQVFLEHEGAAERCRGLRRVICSGEALSTDLQNRFLERFDAELHNLYGPTEAAIDVTYWKCQREENQRSVPIGRPIANTELYILDEEMQPVPIGVAGELYLGGIGLARGYWQRPELTAEKFIPHPYSRRAGQRLYRTGDVARYRSDGAVEFLGRRDEQVKVRGYRIELGEIETVLRQHPAAQEALVVAREGARGEKRLVGYVVRTEGSESVTMTQWRSYLSERLPEYMIPAVMLELEKLPLTPNGKVDWRALPEPDGSRPEMEQGYVEPRTEVEEVLCRIWAEVLGVKQVGIHDNYFELGGDSIRSVRVLALAQERGLKFSLQQLFQHQTVGKLAAELNLTEMRDVAGMKLEPFSLISADDREKLPDDVEDAYPLTMLQSGMLFHMNLMPDSPLYHNINSYHLRAAFDLEALREVVQHVVARHPVLRTSFDMNAYSEPLQLVHRTARLPVDADDLRHLSFEEQEQEINGFVEREKQHRFDFSRPPLLRFHVHRRSDDSFQFTLTECHAIFDGWSLQTTLTEIFSRYIALLSDETVPEDAPLATSFRDFVFLEREALASEECQSFWNEKLDDAHLLELPARSAPAQSGGGPRVNVLDIHFPDSLSDELHQLARSAAVPLKSVFLAAHVKVMSIIGGQTDVLTGLSSNGRPEVKDGEQVRGLFLNMVPFRLNCSAGSWMDLVWETFKSELELMPYRRYPLAAMQKRVGSQRLLKTLFNYLHFHVLEGILRSDKAEVSPISKSWEENSFALAAHIYRDPVSDHALLHISFDVAEFSEQQMEAIAGYYLAALKSMVADPQARHESQSLLSAEEARQLLIEWNETATAYPVDMCVHELFAAQAAQTPDAVALVFDDVKLSYRELNERANQLAHHLKRFGVGPETLVGLLMERSVEMIVGLLGILKAGGAYVPLDPASPVERLSFMLEDTQLSVLLGQERLTEDLPVSWTQVISLDTEWEAIADESAENPDTEAGPLNLAYVTYTSGSTGKPKGVSVTHQSVVRLVRETNYASLTADEVFLQFAPIFFDASTFEVWGALLNGARLVIMPAESPSLEELAEALRRYEITTLWLTAGLFHQMVDAHPAELGQVRQLLAGGDVLSVPHVEKVLRTASGTTLINGYGPTEGTTFTCCYPMTDADDIGSSVPIGRPIANTQVYILDEEMQPAPVGVAGELYIGGDGLARGYWQRPELTAEKFVPHPHSSEGDRLYRSGDLARYLADGRVEFLGRRDQQVKLRGYRIELGEIEAVLRQHRSVRDAVVVIQQGQSSGQRLVAYLARVEGAEAQSSSEWRAYLAEQLPDYMIPALYIELAEFPLTPNGKVDRQALPEVDAGRPELEEKYAGPTDEVEATLCGIWAEVLGVEQVGIHDDFFELGGHSLLATLIIARVRNSCHVDVPMRLLFEFPTVAGLAKVVRQEEGVVDEGDAIKPVGREDEEQLLSKVDEISDEEVALLLGSMLNEGEFEHEQ
jgi:amino acid adenylation domain-containing protein